MALVTGTPLGTVTQQDSIYIDSAPPIYFQHNDAGTGAGSVALLNAPDSNGFYWGLSGTTSNPVYQLGCVENVQLQGNITMASIRCDTTGDQGAIQKLSYIDITATLKTLMPLSVLRQVIRGGAVTTVAGSTEQFGIGQPDNSKYYYVWLPTVYDQEAGDYLAITGFRAQFVDSWQLAFAYGQPATMGIAIRLFADNSKPADQLFASVLRADPSAIA